MNQIWKTESGVGPIVAVAVHDGHDARREVRQLFALSDEERLREEDPFTGKWTTVAPTRIIACRSRFEVDLNRSRNNAVYRIPEDAWGLNIWKEPLSDEVLDRSLAEYDAFYENARTILSAVENQYGRFVVFDLHSYNHRRNGPNAQPADPDQNPQVNIGTGTMDRARWGQLVDRFIGDLRDFPFPGGNLDVRENVKFRGGRFSCWVHETFPQTGCAIAIEFKKFFMDEWTGTPDAACIESIRNALQSTLSGIHQELDHI